MGRYAWIIFIIFVAWQIITGVAQNAAKKQQQEKMNEIARRRRAAGQGGASESRRTSGDAGLGERGLATPSATATAGGRGARMEDLAARRKAQLEELRRRRTAGASTGTGGGSRPAPPARTVKAKVGPASRPPSRMTPTVPVSMPGTGRRSASSEAGVTDMKADLRTAQSTQADDRRVRDEQMRRHLQDVEAQQRRADVESKRSLAQRGRQAGASTPSADVESASEAARRSRRARADRFKRLMKSRRTLQDLFVLKELLDPPVSMR